MRIEALLLIGGTFLVSALLTKVVLRLALAAGVMDVPNDRSSHSIPTPRGGGAAIVIATFLGILASYAAGWMDTRLVVALLGCVAVAFIGYLDDRHPVPSRVRLAVHVAAALWALGWLGGLAPLRFGGLVHTFEWGGYVLGVLGIVWTLNLFNFMDGIDGIAGAEGIFVAAAGAFIALLAADSASVPLAAFILAAACAGFLIWNWPPARIFMGDVGSGSIGYLIAVLALAAARESDVALIVWVILGAVFFIDATVTLVHRASRRVPLDEAHRSHAYQRLARRWGSHRRVTLSTIAVNLLWLLPCSYVAAVHTQWAGWMLLVAWAPLIAAALLAGAGSPECESAPPGRG